VDDFYKNILTPSWWIGVVIVGIIINMASAYMKSLVDKFGAKASDGIRRRSREATERRKNWIDFLRTDQHAQLVLHAREQRLRTQANTALLLSVLLFLLGLLFGWSDRSSGFKASDFPMLAIGPFGMAALAMVSFKYALTDASKCAGLIKEAMADYPLPYN